MPALLSLLSIRIQALQFAPPFDVNAQAIYVVNQETDVAIYEKNARQKIYPASTTKIMTTLLALENIPDLTVEISYRREIYDLLNQINIRDYDGMLSMAGLLPGETISIEKLIYGAMLPSGNECAYLLANYMGEGSVDNFIGMMNERAQALKMVNTHFSNPAGLEDEQNYSTAYDMYLLTKEAMKNSFFQKVVSTTQYEAGPTNLHDALPLRNTNQMIVEAHKSYYSPIYGIKTGTLDSAGRCFVSAAQQDGLSYFTVMMKAPYMDAMGNILPYNASFQETQKLYEWIFSSLELTQIIEKGQEWKEIPIQLGGKEKPTLKVMTNASFRSILPKGTALSDFKIEETYPDMLVAPVEMGASVGEMTLSLKDEIVCTIPLISAETVERDFYQYFLYQAEIIFESYGALILIASGFIIVAVVCVARRRRKAKRLK